MSLEAVRKMRRAGHKPQVVMVVVGQPSDLIQDDAGIVIVRPTDSPAAMDWRPLIGVVVAVYTLSPLPHLTIAVLDALQAAGAKLFGAADRSGVYALLEGADEQHERLLRRSMELLCQS
jgi:hypothetical protein